MATADELRNKFMAQRRQDIETQANRADQQQQEALNRRFTSLGQGASGAAIKAGQLASQGIQEQKGRQLGELEGQAAQQELATQLQREQIAGQQGFAKEMAGRDEALKREFFNTEQENKLKQLDLAERQFQLDKDAQEFNKRLAEIEAGRQPGGMFDNLLGNRGGFMGTGVGGGTGATAGRAQTAILTGGISEVVPGIGGGK